MHFIVLEHRHPLQGVSLGELQFHLENIALLGEGDFTGVLGAIAALESRDGIGSTVELLGRIGRRGRRWNRIDHWSRPFFRHVEQLGFQGIQNSHQRFVVHHFAVGIQNRVAAPATLADDFPINVNRLGSPGLGVHVPAIDIRHHGSSRHVGVQHIAIDEEELLATLFGENVRPINYQRRLGGRVGADAFSSSTITSNLPPFSARMLMTAGQAWPNQRRKIAVVHGNKLPGQTVLSSN